MKVGKPLWKIMFDPEMQKEVDRWLEKEQQGKIRPWCKIKEDLWNLVNSVY